MILYGPFQLGSRTSLLCRTLLGMRSLYGNLLVFTFEFKYRAMHRWYIATQSCESHFFSSRNSSSVFIRSYFAMGQSCPFSGNLHQVRLGSWLCICRPARMAFIQLLIWRWFYRPKAPLGDRLPTFLSGFWASSSGCVWLSCSQLQPAHFPNVVQPTRRLS